MRQTRFDTHDEPLTNVRRLKEDDPAIVENRPVFHNMTRHASSAQWVLKSGFHSRKIGVRWEKIWPGIRVFTLTLPERATCPICRRRYDCYGNKMKWAVRWIPDPALLRELEREIRFLIARYGRISIRLHVLGDFVSIEYVRFWTRMVEQFGGLHLFGFTAWTRGTPIGDLIEDANNRWFERVVIRFSEGSDELSAKTIEFRARGRIPEGIVCPAQTRNPTTNEPDTTSCTRCGLCLKTRDPIVFMLH